MLMVSGLTSSDIASRGFPVLDLYLAQLTQQNNKEVSRNLLFIGTGTGFVSEVNPHSFYANSDPAFFTSMQVTAFFLDGFPVKSFSKIQCCGAGAGIKGGSGSSSSFSSSSDQR